MSRSLNALGALILGCCLAVLVAEGLLRIYNPFPFRVKGDEIVLPQFMNYRIEDVALPGLDPVVVHNKNSMGFRGPEWPANADKALTIFAVGGSTTECFYLSDGKDWPNVLGDELSRYFENVWINNAGFDGHSTFGHIRLLEQFLLKRSPKVILFLVGGLDVNLEADNKQDRRFANSDVDLQSLRGFVTTLALHSEIVSLALNFYRYHKTIGQGFEHPLIPMPAQAPKGQFKPSLSEVERTKLLQRQNPYLVAYEERLKRLIELASSTGTLPVLITHPIILGGTNATSSGTAPRWDGIHFLQWGMKLDQDTVWRVQQAYNDVTRSIAAMHKVPIVDMAELLPKSTDYFYDVVHFTNLGSRKVASIVLSSICSVLAEKFPNHANLNPCP